MKIIFFLLKNKVELTKFCIENGKTFGVSFGYDCWGGFRDNIEYYLLYNINKKQKGNYDI